MLHLRGEHEKRSAAESASYRETECFHFSVQQPLIALSDVHTHMQMQSFTTVVCYII